MKTSYFLRSMLIFFLVFGMALPGLAGEPTDQIKQTTDKILSIITNPALKPPSKTAEREKLFRQAVDERFNWEEMARRALATHWAKRTLEERQEFVRLFADLLERTYKK